MPESIRKVHDKIDIFVDKLYQKSRFKSDAERVSLLFNLYLHNRNNKKGDGK
jgi:hypothetical protein